MFLPTLASFHDYKLNRLCTVGVINEYHVSAIPAGHKGTFRCKEKERFDDINQSKTDVFEIIATYQNIENFYYSATMNIYLRVYDKLSLQY